MPTKPEVAGSSKGRGEHVGGTYFRDRVRKLYGLDVYRQFWRQVSKPASLLLTVSGVPRARTAVLRHGFTSIRWFN